MKLNPKDWYRDIRWWFKCRFVRKYHVIDTGLPPGYHDTDQMMLYAVMACVKWYVDHDLPIVEDFSEGHAQEILDWFERYKNQDEETPCPECKCEWDIKYGMCDHWREWANEDHERGEKYEAEAKEHLIWIMENRRGFWS